MKLNRGIQWTLDQHGFELLGYTYMRIFSVRSYNDPWLVESVGAKPQIRRDDCKLHADF